MEKTLTPLLVNAGIRACNGGLNRLLGPWGGGAGLAAATAVSITAGGVAIAVLFLWKAGDIRVGPLVKCIGAALVTGSALLCASDLFLTGAEGKLLLVVKCLGLGAAAAVLYVLLMLLTRQRDFMELVKRYKK